MNMIGCFTMAIAVSVMAHCTTQNVVGEHDIMVRFKLNAHQVTFEPCITSVDFKGSRKG